MQNSRPRSAPSHSRKAALLKAAAQPDRLWESWQKVLANRGAPGGDGISVERFGFFAEHAINKLSCALMDGTYRPAPSRRVAIPKCSGGVRPLDIPAVVDRVAQGAVAMTIGPMLDAEMEDSSFAYRPGRGVLDAVRRVAALRREGFGWVVDGDIRRYFENIPHDALMDRVEAITGDDALLDLIGQWLEWYAPGGVGVPQGSPLSPLLANIYLDGVDEAMSGRGIRLVRYADDFLVLTKTEASATGAMERIAAILAEHGLELNAEKSRVVSFEQGFRFLGHLFVRSMLVKEIADDAPDDASVAALGLAAERMVAEDAAAQDASPPVGTWSPGWRVLYVLEPGRALVSDGESFVVTDRGSTMFKLPANRVGRIELAANVPVNPAALDLAAAHDVLIARIDGHGATIAEWVPPGGLALHARRHLAQAGLVLDAPRRLDLARLVVDARLRGQRAVLSRANRDRRDTEISSTIGIWRRVLRSASRADQLDKLMGWEGYAAAQYWPALARALSGDLSFNGKRKRGELAEPFDLVLNALANMLARDIRLALHRVGLHPGMSVLHEARNGEEALAFDLMEEFRAPLVEATALALVNRCAVRSEMIAPGLRGRPRLGQPAWKAIIRGYEAALDRPVSGPGRQGKRTNWRTLMTDQALAWAAHCEGDRRYVPIAMDY